ncbi:hydrolase 76 protein [Kappamyces sp. JEL0829]|nr:hydrolase 76 protein [Kappamyces sp. JEL0829]
MSYYKPNSQGCVLPNTAKDASGFQYYEGGIMWGAMLEYMKTTQGSDSPDLSFATTVVNGLTLSSFGTVGSFLGKNQITAETLEGKWNDDILWWALPAATGAEMFGSGTVMPGGISYLALSNTTYQQVQTNYDPTCQGGLWWSRDRNNAKFKGYKSTITQAQQIALGARLSILTGKQDYITQALQIYQWMKTTGLVSSDWKVYDGIDADRGCAINGDLASYQTGFLTGGLAWLFQASKKPELLTDAHSLFAAALPKFAPNGIITDTCESASAGCFANQVSPKGTMVRGWGYLYEFTTSAQIKTQLKQVLQSSVQAMLKTCDNSYNCGNAWSTQTYTSSNVHFQMNSLELMTAYLKTFSAGPVGKNNAAAAPKAAPTVATNQDGPPPDYDFSSAASYSRVAVVAASLLYLVL